MKTIHQNAEYKAATEQLTQLMEALAAARDEEAALLAQLSDQTESKPTALARAVALLGGQQAPARQDLDGLRARLTACRETLALLGEAIAEQQQAIGAIVGAHSFIVNSEARQGHIKGAERIKTALAGLRTALEEEQAIRAEIGDAGYSCTLEPIESYALNFLDPDSYVGRFERDVSAYLLRCEIQSKKTVNVRVLCACNAGAVGDVLALPGIEAAQLVHTGQAELTDSQPRRKPLTQVISEHVFS